VKRLAFAVPGDLETPTGGYAYDRRMIAELNALGWNVDVINLGEGFPHIDTQTRARACATLAAIPQGRPIVIDGLALGVLPEAAALLHARNPLIALVHHPLALESGLTMTETNTLRASERAALAHAHRTIVTSPSTARLLTLEYDVPAALITVAQPGCDPAAPAKGSSDGNVRLLSVGSLVPRKGHDVLIAALATLSDLPWRLTIAGDAERDFATAAAVKKQITRAGLTERITLAGAVTPARLAELYLASDMFVLASRFEGYGMAYAEAIAHGLPVIGTTAGAIPETLPNDIATLVPPDNAAALAHALRDLIADTGMRRRMAAAARAAATRLPTWAGSALLFAAAIEVAS
jgi:glycosyltransferase involved in cell wall biosynthesis